MEESISKQSRPESDFFRALTDLLPEAYLLLTPDGRVLAGNASAGQLFARSDFAQCTLGSLVADPPAKVDRSLQIWSETGSMTPASLTLPDQSIIRADGARIGAAACALIVIRCIPRSQAFATRELARHSLDHLSFQKNIAEKLALARQQKETAETTAAMFAHEIANPLNGISTALDVLQLEAAESSIGPVASDILKSARQEIARLASLLNDFRALARPQVLDFRPVDLKQLVDEVMLAELAAATANGIRYEAAFDPALPPLMADKNRLKQAILNLCKNAVEAMPDGGRLTIGTRRQNGIIILEISDTGLGIPAGLDPFQVFKTTKAQGTGLGLSIAAQILASHKGRIEYRSEPTGGTTFMVHLPISSKLNETTSD